MAQTTIWKPSTINSWKGGIAFLADASGPRTPPTVTLPDGRTITGKYINTNEGRHQWVFPAELAQMSNIQISYNGQTGTIASGATSYEGGSLTSWQARAKGSIGDTSGGFGGASTGGFGAATIGSYGVAPQFIGNLFPQASLSQYDPIPGAAKDYQYIDPIKFGQEFTPFQRTQLAENFKQAKGFALDALDTELEGLLNFVPKSAALKREIIGEENTFNQAERTRQIESAIPDVARDLESIAGDARTYAKGEIPNSVIDRGLSIGVGSAAADIAATSGFGVRSSAARKTADLMSAKERIALSQYGEGLLSNNAAQRAQLFLAPTQYSTGGSQINVTPTLSGSQLQTGTASELNQATNVPASQAFANATQQSQYITGLQQTTQQFNASNTLQNNQFNATALNNFALSYFNYLNSYVNSLAGATQTNINTGVALDQQQIAGDVAADAKHDTQQANDIKDGISAVGQIIGGIVGFSDIRLKENIQDYISGLNDLLKLKVIKYQYKKGTVADDGHRPHVGVIAQEVQKVFPTSVGKHTSGFFQIDPAELIYALIGAVQVLNSRISNLENA